MREKPSEITIPSEVKTERRPGTGRRETRNILTGDGESTRIRALWRGVKQFEKIAIRATEAEARNVAKVARFDNREETSGRNCRCCREGYPTCVPNLKMGSIMARAMKPMIEPIRVIMIGSIKPIADLKAIETSRS